MTFEAVTRALESRFADSWPYTSIKWPNVGLPTALLDEWVCFNHIHDESKIAQIGTSYNVNRYYGVIVVQIFVKPNIGLLRAKVLSDYVSDIWRTFQFSGIVIDVPEIVEIGILNGWYQLNVQNNYQRSNYEQISTPLVDPMSFSSGFNTGFN